MRSEECEGDARSLVEVLTDTVNSAEELAQTWEEIEFLVDSGASATVAGDEMVRVARATDPIPNANYRLADGSTIPNKGLQQLRGIHGERLQASGKFACD